MGYAATAESTARVHQALADANRLRLLEVIRANPGGLDAPAAAAEIGLHATTTRQHLEMLVETGLVERVREERTARGRPRVLYRATPDREESAAGGYRLLAEILASLIESSVRNPADRAEMGGAAWGRSLVERARPLERLSRAEAVRRVAALLEELGFEPEAAGDSSRILLHRCPFRDVADAHRAVVCSAHLGVIKGALAELGAPAEGATLEPMVTPTLCIAHLTGGRRARATAHPTTAPHAHTHIGGQT